jgi:hypothetical protein
VEEKKGIKPKKGGGNKPWDYMFESWLVYGTEFPERKNCVCIDTHAKLNNWVKEQHQKSKDGTLSKERFRQLKDKGFCFASRQINDVVNDKDSNPNLDEVTKDDVDVKRVGEAVPPPKKVGDKVEPLTELIVATVEPLSNHNNLNPDHAKMGPLLLESEIPTAIEKLEVLKEAHSRRKLTV